MELKRTRLFTDRYRIVGMLLRATLNNKGCNTSPQLTPTWILQKVLIQLWALNYATNLSMGEVTDILSTVTGIGVQMCAARCFEIRSCKSFAFRDGDLTCHLLSVVKLKTKHLEGFTVTPKVKMLDHPCAKTRCGTGTRCVMDRQGHIACVRGFKSCGIPRRLPGADVMYGDLFLGDKAQYTCTADYRSCLPSTVSTCLPTGQWENVTGVCALFRWRHPDPMPIPFEAPFPCGGHRRLFLSIQGQMTGSHSKSFPERINENNVLVTNTYINGTWGYEKKHRIFPFKVHGRFVLVIALQDGVYTVKVKGETYLSLKEELPDAQPDSVRVVGDVRLETVEIGSGIK